MVQIKVEAKNYEIAEHIIKLIEESGLAETVKFEDPDDLTLKPIEVIDFYKKINAANNSFRDNTVLTQAEIEKEATTW